MTPPSLPIDAFLPQAVRTLHAAGALVLTAEPGAGKTTRLPPALLDSVEGEVWVLEPRRLAARLAASHVAAERGVALGELVGYQVRFDTRAGVRTRLRYVTEGVLVRRLGEGPKGLEGIGAVVLDEFHERHLETDLALALVEHARHSARPELKLVVMSATLDADPLAQLLGAPTLAVPGRVYPVEIEHAAGRDERPLEDQVHDAVQRLCSEGLSGHVLVFLPGTGEIRRASERLAHLSTREDLLLLPLHGQLGAEETARALQPSQRRKVLLATNVAESSLTIDGVEAVVDSGLARVAGVSPQTGLRTLTLQPIPRASAVQRAHRAGRQGPGRCLRLYTRVDLERRPREAVPELLRSELSGPLLLLRAAGLERGEAVPWLDPPPGPALSEAEELLRQLGATDASGRITLPGRALLRYPLEPRLARVAQAGAERGVGVQAATAAALLGERSLRARSEPAHEHGPSDVLVLLDLLAEARAARFKVDRLRRLGIDARAARAADRAAAQVVRQLEGGRRADTGGEEQLLQALLAGHPDRVARRARPSDDQLVLARGGQARLGPESTVAEAEWLIVLDAADPRTHGRAARARLASAIKPDWLLELFPDDVEEAREVRWDTDRERVEARWALRYGQLVLEESVERGGIPEADALLREKAMEAGPAGFCDGSALEALQRRHAFARRFAPDLPELAPEETLAELCEGRRSFAELRQADLMAHVLARFGYEAQRTLERLAPEQVALKGGRRCRITYEARQDPWISSRLQDFFGMDEGPRIGGGEVSLVLHLLAPNRQAVSVTTDLAGFWGRTYPVEARRLRRRYPRHLWPEDPATAHAPRPGRVR